LLDSYERERRPVGQYNAEQSLQNAVRLMEVPRALGFSLDAEESRRNFAAILGDPQRRGAVADAIAQQAEHFDMLGLQLGYAYESGALLPDGSPPLSIGNRVREFVPSSRPGARLPHGWLLRSGGARCSSLDLIRCDRWTLLVGPDGGAWADAARAIDPSVACVQLAADVADPEDWWGTSAGMAADGALLVRPDQHVAFRARRAANDPRATLRDALVAARGEAAAMHA
jgi:2,4-dichlorophenol 6-monooxygenase